MKLVIAIVHGDDADKLVTSLTEKEYRVTRLHSQGGFLKQTNASVILGVDDHQVDDVIATIREKCKSRTQFINPMPPLLEPGEFLMPQGAEITLGGATVFVLHVERHERV